MQFINDSKNYRTCSLYDLNSGDVFTLSDDLSETLYMVVGDPHILSANEVLTVELCNGRLMAHSIETAQRLDVVIVDATLHYSKEKS